MVGFYARADANQPIRTDLDNELVGQSSFFIKKGRPSCRTIDARWYTRAEIITVLNHPTGGKFGTAEYKKMTENEEGKPNDDKHLDPALHLKTPDDPPFRLPPATAIAGVLIRDWVEGKISFIPAPTTTLHKGSL
jgi:NAD+ diphosphatase